MGRVVLRHLSGSKSGQLESFVREGFTAVLVGRDPAANVRYDPRRDDLVGRQHARIEQDAAGGFTVTDLESRNGTFVNGERIVGSSPIRPGDVLQFGLGGPELEFQFDAVNAAGRFSTAVSLHALQQPLDLTPPVAPPDTSPTRTAPRWLQALLHPFRGRAAANARRDA